MNVILCSLPIFHEGTLSPRQWTSSFLSFCSNYNMKPEMYARGLAQLLPCYTDAIAAWRPLCFHSCTDHVQFFLFPKTYSSLRICANTVWKWKFNGYCNECWLNGSEIQEDGNERDPERRRGLFRCSGVVRFHEEEWFWGGNMIIFFLLLCLIHRGVVCYKKAGRSLDTHH